VDVAVAPSSVSVPGGEASAGARAVSPSGVGAVNAPSGGAGRLAIHAHDAPDNGFARPGAAEAAQVQAGQSSIYCFQVVQPAGYEPELVVHQFEKRVGIFACDRWTVFSSKAMELSSGLRTTPVKSDLQCETGGEFETALNTEIFMAVWAEVLNVGEFERARWTVKVDADCVFFPERLQPKLQGLTDEPNGVYLNNCALGMHGPLEVFSLNAVLAWTGGAERCTRHFQKLCNGPCLWGEDMFIDQCLWKVLGVSRVDDWSLLLEAHCAPRHGWASCQGQFAGFHPFKTPADWWRCYQGAMQVSNVTAL
jgi:hypothetical protein